MIKWIWIALGGGLGAVIRFLLVDALQNKTGSMFPWGTFTVNVLGCFLIGLVWAFLNNQNQMIWAPFLIIGVLGGFTTFSSFGLESVQLFKAGKTGVMMAYVLLSNMAGLLAVVLGNKLVDILGR